MPCFELQIAIRRTKIADKVVMLRFRSNGYGLMQYLLKDLDLCNRNSKVVVIVLE